MDFKKLQKMQQALDNAILAEKPKMSAEELLNKTLVALSVEVAEVANCSEHFKHWKINKGKVDNERFSIYDKDSGESSLIGYKFDKSDSIQVTNEQAHHLTLIEEAADCLHFILSLANQLDYEINMVSTTTKDLTRAYLDIQWSISCLNGTNTNNVHEQLIFDLVNNYFSYIGNLGMLQPELEQAYYDKNEVNYQRLREGY